MKKIIFSLLSISVIVIIAITYCKKTDEVINSNLKEMSFESFEKYGKIHNDFLSYFKNEFVINPDTTSSERIDYFESITQAHNLGIIDDFEFNSINLIGQKAKDNHDGLISYEENPDAFGDNQKSTKALSVGAASDIAGAGYSAVVAKMDLKTILISISIGIISGGLAELIVKWFYKNKKKNNR